MVKLVTSGLVIDAMNAIAEEETEATNGGRRILDVGDDQQSADNEAEGMETSNGNPEEIRPEVQQEIPTAIPPDNPEEDQEEHQESAEEQARDDSGREPSITTRLGRDIRRPTRYLAVTKLNKQDWKEREADKAIKAELTTFSRF
jgi:hypothetical protein